jgi:hypothetical protein
MYIQWQNITLNVDPSEIIMKNVKAKIQEQGISNQQKQQRVLIFAANCCQLEEWPYTLRLQHRKGSDSYFLLRSFW